MFNARKLIKSPKGRFTPYSAPRPLLSPLPPVPVPGVKINVIRWNRLKD